MPKTVWDAEKLKLDMTVIALVQRLALGYGIHTAFLARPVYLVFAVDRFEAVTAAEIPAEAKATGVKPVRAVRSSHGRGPPESGAGGAVAGASAMHVRRT